MDSSWEDFSTSDGKFVLTTPSSLTASRNVRTVCVARRFQISFHANRKKTYQDLPKHDRLMIRATYHFIDQWGGETGFADERGKEFQDAMRRTDAGHSRITHIQSSLRFRGRRGSLLLTY